MVVDVSVSRGLQAQIEASVAGEELQHVVEERNRGIDARFPAAVQFQTSAHRGLICAAIDLPKSTAHDRPTVTPRLRQTATIALTDCRRTQYDSASDSGKG